MADGGGFSRQAGDGRAPGKGRTAGKRTPPPKPRSQGSGLFGAAAELKKKGGGGWSPWDIAETLIRTATPLGATATAIERAVKDPSFGSIARAAGAVGTAGMSELGTVPLAQSAVRTGKGDAGWGDAIMVAGFLPIFKGPGAIARALRGTAGPRGVVQAGPAGEVAAATRAARKTYAEQEALRKAERGKRIGRAEAAYEEAGGGRAGQAAAKAELKGKLPAVPFNELTHLDEAGMRKLTDFVDESELLGFEKLALRDALYGLQGGKVPRPFEVKLIGRVFGPEKAAEASSLGLIAKVGRGVAEVVNIPRALETTLDISFVARQALVMLAHNPKLVGKNLPTMFRAMGSEKSYQDFHRALIAHPNYERWTNAGVRFTDLSKKLGVREEPFQSNLAEKITAVGFKGVGRGHGPVRASNRAFTTMSNALRFGGAEKMADDFGEAWLAAGGTQAELDHGIAKFVNWATGRGGLGKFEGAAVPLNAVFFAPRLFSSRVQTFNPWFYASLPKPVRVAAMKATLKLVSGGTTILGLAALGGARVGLDPRSADFGKIRAKNTRYDIWGGHQQIAKLVAQIATGEIISSTTGKKMSLRGGYGVLDRMDITYRFGESKLAPPASLVKDLFRGTDFEGKPFSWKKQVVERMWPLLIQDAVGVYQETGSPLETGLAYGIGAFGVGVQNYAPGAKEKRSPASPRPRTRRPGSGDPRLNRGTGGGFSRSPDGGFSR